MDEFEEIDADFNTEYLSGVLEEYDEALEAGRQIQTGELDESYDKVIGDYCAQIGLRMTAFEDIDRFGEFKNELTKIASHKIYEEMRE